MPKTDWLKELNPDSYKEANLASWQRNTDYWFSEPLRHIVDNDSLISTILDEFVKPGQTVVDMGCGDGFLYRRISERFPNVKYVGLDFNGTFIDKLKQEFESDKNANFVLCDFEKEVPVELVGTADVVFSFFVLLEIENIGASFEFANSLLKSSGHFSLWTIEYTYLILAVSRSLRDFKNNLERYESIRAEGKVPFTFQKIDLGDGESEDLTYGTVFHSTADYISCGLGQGWTLTGMIENIHSSKFHPKVYQCFKFEK